MRPDEDGRLESKMRCIVEKDGDLDGHEDPTRIERVDLASPVFESESSPRRWEGPRAVLDLNRSAFIGDWREACFPLEFSAETSQNFESIPSTSGRGWDQEGEGGGVYSAEAEGTCLKKGTFLGVEREDFGKDFQHKRAKVLDYDMACHYAGIPASLGADLSNSCASEDHSFREAMLVPSGNEMVHYFGSMQDDACCRKSGDSNGKGDGDDGCGTPNMDDEVRMDLMEDLLHMVFSFLDCKDLIKAGATCKQWRAASAHEDFWRCLNFEDWNIPAGIFAAICHRYPKATQVNILGVPDVDMLAMEAITSLRKIECLTLGKGQLGDAFFQALTDCHALKSLSISDASLGGGIQEINVQHERLCDLQIVKCRVLRISVRCPKLQTLSLKRTSMAHALLTCPLLLELAISSCHKLSDAGIRSAATSCPLLTSLDMSSCSCVSDETLREIAFACPDLHVLDASFCPNISLESVRLPMLTGLKLQNCEGITSASMAAISKSYMLEALQLDCCSLLTSVSLDMPRLQNISLVHCRKFVDLNLWSPALSSVKVSNCSALHRINIISNALQKLVLQKQESLSILSLQCYTLQEVDLTDCESLTNSICEVFSDGGGCPMLRSLVLDNCERLTRVAFNSSSLASLSLVGCRAMTDLELSCPILQKVDLDGCDHLERASLCPVDLWSLNLGICPRLCALSIEAPNMFVLELKGCGVLTSASINCPRLLSLDASFCMQLNDDSLSTTSASCLVIESLILSSCLSIGLDGLSSLHWLRHLTLLDLSYTFLTNLQPVFDSCRQLETLKLMACKYLSNSSLDSLYKEGALPVLRELDLSYSTVGQLAIEELLTSCTNLTNVNLNGCLNMHDLDWALTRGHLPNLRISKCPSGSNKNKSGLFRQPDRMLETLNCVGCSNIRRVVIPQIACCFHLKELNFNMATNLKEVDLACPSLNKLVLSQCSSLEVLKLDCPRLVALDLTACFMLNEETVEEAIQLCPMLETLSVQHCPKIHPVMSGRLRMVCPSLKRILNSLWD